MGFGSSPFSVLLSERYFNDLPFPFAETVTVAGLKVPHQEFGVVDAAAWNGDLYTSGLLGLCFPNLTSVFTGTDPDKDSLKTNLENYNPFFFTAVKEKKVKNPCQSNSHRLFRTALTNSCFGRL